jgi:HPt (histidine-containing phosphotransfer) domain-containing protein
MDEHISKPINALELLEILERFSALAGRGTAPGGGDGNKIGHRSALDSDSGVFDLEALRSRLCGDEEAVKEIAGLFLEEIPDMVVKLRSAALAEDWPLLAKLAHTLKGASASFGANSLAEVAGKIEQAAEKPRDPRLNSLLSEMDGQLVALKKSIARVFG